MALLRSSREAMRSEYRGGIKKNLAASHPVAAVNNEGQRPAYQTEKAVAMKKVV